MGRTGTRGAAGGRCERHGRWVLQGKRYLRGWKIDSNLATLRRSERTPPGNDGGWCTVASSPVPAQPPVVTQVRPPSPPLLPSTFVRFPLVSPQHGLVSTHPYTSRKLISGLRRVRSRALRINSSCAPLGFPTPPSKALLSRSPPSSLSRSDQRCAASSPRAPSLLRPARMALTPRLQ